MIVPNQFGQHSHYSFQQKIYCSISFTQEKQHIPERLTTQLFKKYLYISLNIFLGGDFSRNLSILWDFCRKSKHSSSNLPTNPSNPTQPSNRLHVERANESEACQSERPGSIEDVEAALLDGAEANFWVMGRPRNWSRVIPGTPKDMGPPYGKRDPYYSHKNP